MPQNVDLLNSKDTRSRHKRVSGGDPFRKLSQQTTGKQFKHAAFLASIRGSTKPRLNNKHYEFTPLSLKQYNHAHAGQRVRYNYIKKVEFLKSLIAGEDPELGSAPKGLRAWHNANYGEENLINISKMKLASLPKPTNVERPTYSNFKRIGKKKRFAKRIKQQSTTKTTLEQKVEPTNKFARAKMKRLQREQEELEKAKQAAKENKQSQIDLQNQFVGDLFSASALSGPFKFLLLGLYGIRDPRIVFFATILEEVMKFYLPVFRIVLALIELFVIGRVSVIEGIIHFSYHAMFSTENLIADVFIHCVLNAFVLYYSFQLFSVLDTMITYLAKYVSNDYIEDTFKTVVVKSDGAGPAAAASGSPSTNTCSYLSSKLGLDNFICSETGPNKCFTQFFNLQYVVLTDRLEIDKALLSGGVISHRIEVDTSKPLLLNPTDVRFDQSRKLANEETSMPAYPVTVTILKHQLLSKDPACIYKKSGSLTSKYMSVYKSIHASGFDKLLIAFTSRVKVEKLNLTGDEEEVMSAVFAMKSLQSGIGSSSFLMMAAKDGMFQSLAALLMIMKSIVLHHIVNCLYAFAIKIVILCNGQLQKSHVYQSGLTGITSQSDTGVTQMIWQASSTDQSTDTEERCQTTKSQKSSSSSSSGGNSLSSCPESVNVLEQETGLTPLIDRTPTNKNLKTPPTLYLQLPPTTSSENPSLKMNPTTKPNILGSLMGLMKSLKLPWVPSVNTWMTRCFQWITSLNIWTCVSVVVCLSVFWVVAVSLKLIFLLLSPIIMGLLPVFFVFASVICFLIMCMVLICVGFYAILCWGTTAKKQSA